MEIKKLEINNFRSIKELIIEPNSLNALVGPNSSGKTNILKAIDLVLGEGWATKAKVARELFHDTSQNIFIKITFNERIPWLYYGKSIAVNCVTLEMSYQPLECTVRLWSDYPNDKNGDGYYLNDVFKKQCHFIYIPAHRDLSAQMRVSNWTLLGKLMKLVYDNYVNEYDSEEDLKEEFEQLMEQPKEFLENDFNQSQDIVTFKNFVDEFVNNCQSNSTGLATAFIPSLDIYNLNWFYKTLQIHIKEEFPEKTFDVEEVGSGMQNIILISLFQSYARLVGGNVIFGIEEPEIFLYPQAQRSLYDSFKELSVGSQIFYTTHNPNFVDASRAHEVHLVRKNQEEGTFILEKDPIINQEEAGQQQFKIYTQFNSDRNELFFARQVLLVEGDSDKILWSTLCSEKWGIDLNKGGVAVIECGGKGGVNYFVGVCKLMGIEDYFAIWDSDDENYSPNHDHLSDLQSKNKGLEIPGNIESFLSQKFPQSSFRTDHKVEDSYLWALHVKEEDIPEEFDSVRDFLVKSLLNKKEESGQQEDVANVDEDEDIDNIPF
ncbi:MAG: ATP-dependent nuclease [Patescibacteria group bacterium]